MEVWFVINGFLSTPAFKKQYALIRQAAEAQDIELVTVTNVRAQGMLAAGYRPDCALFWDKDVRVAQVLELAGIRCFNSARAIELCDDKAKTYLALAEAGGIEQPQTIMVPHSFGPVSWGESDFVADAMMMLEMPMVGKMCFGSFGNEVAYIRSRHELVEFLDSALGEPAILQEAIHTSVGRDVRVQVVGGDVVASMLRQAPAGGFASNVASGGITSAFDPDESFRRTAVAAANALGLDFAGVDLLFGHDGQPVVCEVNSNAHFVGLHELTGINPAESIFEHMRKEMSE